MIDYDKKYLELTQGISAKINPLQNKYKDFSGFDKCVLALRLHNLSYGEIQQYLGMPSKKEIRSALLRIAPELIDNSKQKIAKTSPTKRVAGILQANNQYTFDLDEFGESTFELDGEVVYFTDEWGYKTTFSTLDERSQISILNNICKILNLGFSVK